MEKDEVIFTLGMVKSMYPQIWKDSPEEIQKFIKDVYNIELDVISSRSGQVYEFKNCVFIND